METIMRPLFKNNSDCYADTWMDIGTDMVQGEVIQAMTEDRFIEVLKQFAIFTPEELREHDEKVAEKAWSASRDYFLHMKELGDLGIECSLPNKTEYLKSLKG